MGQIGNTILYPFDVSVSLLDYLLGTDATDNKKAKSYQLKRLVEILNIVNGGSAVAYHFSDGSDITLTVTEPGYFFSETNIITPNTLTKLHFNNFTIENKDVSVFLDKMITSGLFKFKLSNLSNPNNFVYLTPSNVVLSTEYLSFDVADFNDLHSGNLLNNADYVLSFDLASNLVPVSDPLKLDKSTYSGNAQDLDTRIDVLETVISTEYTTIVYVNTNSPNLATVFDDVNPPVANNNALKANENNLYIGVDLSTWVYNSLVLGYVTKIVTLTSNFYLSGTTTDAGNNKNSPIKRDGTVETTGFIKSGATSDDVLIGDGSTVSLGAIGSSETAASIKTKYESNANTNAFTDTLKAKLDSITEIFTTALKATYDGAVAGYNALMLTGLRLITSGEITKLSNTSGTNTGDQDLSGKQNQLTAGTNITIDNTNPLAPVISASGAGSSETTTTMGALINSATAATPNDTDLVATAESAGLLKKITWTNVKAFLKTYFDTLYTTSVKTIDGIPIAGTGNLVSKNGFITQSLGDIYNKSTWVDVSDFTVSGGASISVSSGKIQLGTSTPSTFTSVAKINNKISLLEKFSIKATVKVLSNAVDSYGIGFGIDTVNAFGGAGLLARFTTFPTTNTLILNNSTSNAEAANVATFSIALNDILYLELNYLGAGLVKVNLTKGTTTITSTYQFALTGASLPNTGQFCIKTFGGNYELQSLQIDSLENKYADLMVIGDSKTQGYYATTFPNRFCDILRGTYPTVVNSGGGWDRSIEAIARIDELKSLTPKNVILHVGSNDKRSGETYANWNSRFMTLKTEMESVGSTVYAMKMFNETVLTFTDYNDFIDANFATNRIIDVGTVTLNADNIHPNDAGNIQIANAIKAKVSIPNPIVLPITKQVREIGTSFTLNDFDNGSVIILTASCVVTIPNGLVAGFECTIVTLAGVTYSQTLGGSVTFTNNVGVTMAEKLSFTMKNRTAANSYLITGNL